MKFRFIYGLFLIVGFSSFCHTYLPTSNSCNLEINCLNDSTVVVLGYNQSFTVNNEIITGSPTISSQGDTLHLSGKVYSVLLHIKDNSGCSAHKQINKF